MILQHRTRRIILEYTRGRQVQTSGEILLIHGHQGTLDSDFFDFFPPAVLPLYRDLQNLTNFGTAPSRDVALRSRQDNQMYRWVSRQAKLILIAGRPTPDLEPMTHLERLVTTQRLLNLPFDRQPEDSRASGGISREIQNREAKSPQARYDQDRPSYFSTGCCIFETEHHRIVVDGSIRLISGDRTKGSSLRTMFEEASLASIFARL
jgi:hypothetical protein